MSFLAPHPRDWRESIMVDHKRKGCCADDGDEHRDKVTPPDHAHDDADAEEAVLPGRECGACGWIEEHDNPIEVHEAHLAHILAGERVRARQATRFANTGLHEDEE